MRSNIKKRDFETGMKRVNICLTLSEFDDLNLVAEYNGFSHNGSCARHIVITDLRKKVELIRKIGYVPKAQRGENLFGKEKRNSA